MKRHIMLAVDPDRSYLEALTAYVASAMPALSLEIRAVSDTAALSGGRIAGSYLLLLSERCLPKLSGLVDECRAGGGAAVILTEGVRRSPLSGVPAVSKYQSVPDLMRRLLLLYSQAADGEESALTKADMHVFGVYSPAGRCLKSSLALALGEVLAEKRPALLVDLESQPAYTAYFDCAYAGDISDIAAAIIEKKPRIMTRLSALTRKAGPLDYVPPFTVGLDAPDIPGEVWLELIGEIRERSLYEALVIDVGGSVRGLRELLTACDRILMPRPADEGGRLKCEEFLKTMPLWGPLLSEKVEVVDTGPLGPCGLGTEAPETLSRGPLGEIARTFARRCLRQDESVPGRG